MNKHEDNIMDLWNTIQWTDVHIMGFPEEKERKGQKTYLKK